MYIDDDTLYTDIDRILDSIYMSLENSLKRTRIQQILRDSSHEFTHHINYMNVILKKISNYICEPCIKCNLYINYKKNTLCTICRHNIKKITIIKYTNNTITQKLPREIINMIEQYI
jgi:hypothetical protein